MPNGALLSGMMSSPGDRVAQKLDSFEKEKDPDMVYEAMEIIEAADRDIRTWDAAARRQAISRWLNFLASLERFIDPKWDEAAKPVRGTIPPAMEGIVYVSGEVDPESIPDPNARAQYVQALKASEDYARWYDVQYQLRQIEARAMLFIRQILAERFPATQSGRQELEELLATSGLDDVRKERLRAFLTEQDK